MTDKTVDVDEAIDALEAELDQIDNEDVAQVPEGEGNDGAVETDTQEDEPKVPEEQVQTEAADAEPDKKVEHQVPVQHLTDERKAKDEYKRKYTDTQAQLDAANAKLAEANKQEKVEAIGIEPYSEDEITDLQDEYGDALAAKIVTERNNAVALAKITVDQQAKIDRIDSKLTQSAEEKELLESLSETPELRKWYEGMKAGDPEMDKRIELAAELEKAALILHPDSAVDRNKYIERQVSEALGLKPTTTEKPRERSVSIGDMTGGTAVDDRNDADLIQRVLNNDNPSQADLDRAMEASLL